MEGLVGVVYLALFVAAAVLPAVWIHDDAQRRGANAVGWVIAYLVGNFAAMLIWLFVRPPLSRAD